jgi:fumarate reductase subunit C
MVFVREVTAIFVVAYVIVLLSLVVSVGGDPESYEAFRDFLASPGMLVFGVITLLFTLFHSVTFISLIPRGMAVWRNGKRVPASTIAGPGFVVFAAVVAVVLLVLLP